MKKITFGVLTLVFSVLFIFTPVALAADGAKIFRANCAACHALGTNRVNSAKTLKQADLEKWEMNSAEKIIYQVNNGKLAMPAFKGRLNDDEIETVAAYVLEQAENDWKL
ncbi:MAG: c-type cytochrome [Cyanobacteria bacterium J06600_6]